MNFPPKIFRRSVQLLLGLFAYGIGISFMVSANHGAAPWDVLNLGIIRHIPLSFGVANIVVSAAVLLLWFPLKERPGVGTVLNAFLVGPTADLGLTLIPPAHSLIISVGYFSAGLILIALATGLYIGSRFGSGPRDGLMTGLQRITRAPLWVVRTGLEVVVVSVGWLLGAAVGLGTLVFAFLIGPLAQIFLAMFTVNPPETT
ncbi:membrane protein YczE [Leucobacter chinensis]|uniref:membrane protein YczE n=1 Tax=Leucobacter chinensis TaxID=2851010 RepID=UPI003F791707